MLQSSCRVPIMDSSPVFTPGGRREANPQQMRHAMKKILGTMCALLVASFAVQPLAAVAADKQKGGEKAEASAEDAELPAVPASLKDKKFVLPVKLNTKASVYFIYQSRSTCSICVAEAPEIVKIYRSMHGKDAELVMLNIDANKDVAAKWAKSSKMKFPIVAPGEAEGVPFPYTGPNPLPFMVAVDADGNKLGEANGGGVVAFLADWRKMVRDLKKEKKAKAKEEAKRLREEKKAADSADSEEES